MRVLMVGGVESRKNWKGYITCAKRTDHDRNGCGAVLEVEEVDLSLMYWEDRSTQHYYVAVRCPECGKANEVKNVPETILGRLIDSMEHGRSLFDGYSREAQASEKQKPLG